MRFGNSLPVCPIILVIAFKHGCHQIILGWKVPIQAGLGNAGALHHEVHADRANTLAIEEVGGRVEQTISYSESRGRVVRDILQLSRPSHRGGFL
jgi:hypothetical protein